MYSLEGHRLNNRSIAYRPDIDGLRGIAVLAVVLFHAGVGLPGGYVGVDVFFVISGYLITGIIFRQVELSEFRLGEFFVRRVRRIAPAMMAMTSIVLVAGVLFLTPAALDQLATSAFCQQFFVSNIYFSIISDYFAGPAERMPLLHTWTLSVEEQFYVLLPLGLPWVLRWGKRTAQTVLWGLTTGSFVLGVWASIHYPVEAFFWLPTRFWEFSAGSLLALHTYHETKNEMGCQGDRGGRETVSQHGQTKRSRWHLEVLALFALAMLLVSFFSFDETLSFPGYYAAVPVIGTVVLIGLGINYQSLVYQVLSSKVLVGIGLVSYSLYLWHWPILSFLEAILGAPSLGVRLGGVLVSFVVAVCSWRWIEQPVRTSTWFRARKVVGSYIFAVAALASVTLFIAKSDGLPSRMQPSTLAAIENLKIKHQSYATSIADLEAGSVPRIGSLSAPPTFLIWGDSHALAASEFISRRARDLDLGGWIAATGGSPPLMGDSELMGATNEGKTLLRRNEFVLDFIQSHQVTHVFLIAAWQKYRDQDLGIRPLEIEKHSGNQRRPENSLSQTIEYLRAMSIEVWVFRQPPIQAFDVGQMHLNQLMFGWPTEMPPGRTRQQFVKSRRPLEDTFRSIANRFRGDGSVQWVDPTEQFFDLNGDGLILGPTYPFYLDTNHLSSDGVNAFYGEAIDEVFQTMIDTELN